MISVFTCDELYIHEFLYSRVMYFIFMKLERIYTQTYNFGSYIL